MSHINKSTLIQSLSKAMHAGKNSIRPAIHKLKEHRATLLDGKLIGSIIGALAVLLLAWLTVGIGNFNNENNVVAVVVLVVGVAVGATIALTPRERYLQLFIKHFGWIPTCLGTLSYWYWHWYANNVGPVGGNFFDTAAQVLPVILLAAVVDVRRSTTLNSSQLALPIIAVFLGEIAALNESAFNAASVQDGTVNNDFAVVASSLVTAVIALIMAVLADLKETKSETIELSNQTEQL
jgi:hypothetical protein